MIGIVVRKEFMQAIGQELEKAPRTGRKNSPVFVVGCHRSGTNLLYDMLLSAGGFAIYRGILPVYENLIPHFGSFDDPRCRERAIEAFLESKSFQRSGLEVEPLKTNLCKDGRSGGDFIRIIMQAIARAQAVPRWAVYNPDNLPRMTRIKREIPDALFVHIVRDGRDIALSLNRMRGFLPLPWDRSARSLPATALYWEWMVRQGRRFGMMLADDYTEVRYEELVTEPESTLARLGRFLDHDLSYERVRRAGLGRLSESNSSFCEDSRQGQLNPVNRWRERLSREEVAGLEAIVGDCLSEFGYPVSLPEKERHAGMRERWMRLVYGHYLDAKLWLKTNTFAGRLVRLSVLESPDSVSEANSANLR
jgi:Sulfotransferase family